MIVSMTGFAAASAELPGCSLIVELRSVNHRYLDVQVRLPDELRSLDAAVREILTSEVKRGKVDCRIALNHALPGATTLAINAERVVQLRAAAAEVLRHPPGPAPPPHAAPPRRPGGAARRAPPPPPPPRRAPAPRPPAPAPRRAS